VTPEEIAAAAHVLHEARRAGTTIDALPDACRPRTLDEGYAVQDALVALEGARVVGWKLGATTPYWQKRASLTEPMAGRLLEPSVHHGGATLAGRGFHLRMVECEYAFRLARDLPPRDAPYSRDEVEDACAAVHGCIEVADSRFARGLLVDTPSLVADNVLAGAYVVGPEIEGWRTDALAHAPVKVWVEGKVVNEGKGEHTGGAPHPAAGVAGQRSTQTRRRAARRDAGEHQQHDGRLPGAAAGGDHRRLRAGGHGAAHADLNDLVV
jgi:2-keto-4-pentenoate hydratase